MKKKRAVGITIIAALKVAQAIALALIGVGVRHLAVPGVLEQLGRYIARFSLASDQKLVQDTLDSLSNVAPWRLRAIGLAAFGYALMLAIEGTGLFLQKRWAEYLTVIITGSFIPFELFEVVQRVTIGRVLTLLVNVACLAYLVVYLQRHRRAEHAATLGATTAVSG